MAGDHNLPIGLRYDNRVVGVAAHEDQTVDMWRHDGEAEAHVYMDLSTDWVSEGHNGLGEHTYIGHDDRATAIQVALNLITDYHPHWRQMGLVTPVEKAPGIRGRSQAKNVSRYRQRDH